MSEMLEKSLEDFRLKLQGRVFYRTDGNPLNRKTYFCQSIEKRGVRFAVICDNRTFPVEFDGIDRFLGSIAIEPGFQSVTAVNAVVTPNRVTIKSSALPVNKRISAVSDSLLDMFEMVSGNKATKEDIERAKVMIGITNQLVNIEKVNLGYLALKNR